MVFGFLVTLILVNLSAPGRVTNLRVLYRGAHHFLVEWDKPREPNGILTGFEIGYQESKYFGYQESIAYTSLIKFLCIFSSLNHEVGIWFQL